MVVKKILLVDKDAQLFDSINSIFTAKGLALDLITNGKEAIRKVAQKRPDLILLEIALPEMDGWDVCSLLKKNDGTKEIPIIFLSEKSNIQNQLQAFQCGANSFISKPVLPQDLLNQIENFLALKSRSNNGTI